MFPDGAIRISLSVNNHYPLEKGGYRPWGALSAEWAIPVMVPRVVSLAIVEGQALPLMA